MNSDRTNKLYNYLVGIGAENRSEEVFTNDIYNPERREKLYNYLVGIGAENRPLEAFDNDLGFSQVDTPTNEGPDAILKAPKGGSAYEEFKRNMIPLSVEQKPQVATVLPKYEAEPKAEEAPQTLEQMMGELGGNINKLNKTIEGIENIPQTTMEAWEEMHPADLGVMNNPISTGDEYIFQNIESGNIGQREYAFLKGQRENAISRMEAVLAKAKAMREANPNRYEVEARNITDASGVPISGLTTTTEEGALLDTSIRMLEDNIKHYKNAVTKADKVNANKKNGFWKGMGEIDLVNIVSAGWANTLDALKASNIITKANNGGILTPEENLVLEMVKEQGALDEILNAQGGLTSGYKAGQGVAESLPFIVGMATTSGVSGAIKEGIEKGLVTTATKSFRNFAQKAGSKLLGAGVSAIATTPLQSGMWNNYANNTINEWKQYGELQDTAWGRLMDGAADAFTDVFTESLGGVLTKSAKYVLPDLGIKASIAKKFGIHDAFLKDMFDSVQWGNAIGEAGEEFLASFLAPIVRGESFKDMKEEWKDAFSKENIWVTLATTGAMSAGFGALRAIEMGSQVATYGKIKSNVANSLSKINDLELKQTVYDAMQLPTLKDTTEALAQINWRNYDKSDIGYAVEYVYNDLQKNVWNGVNLAEDANKAFSTAMVGIQAVARDGLIKTGEMNGEQVYLLGDVLEGNDKTPIVVLHMDGRREQVPMSAIKEVGIASVDDVVAELYSNTIAEAQQAKAVDQEAEDIQVARAAGVKPVQEQENVGFEEGQIVVVNGEEGEITALDPYTRTARVQVGGNNISVSFDEMQPSAMDEGLQMDEQTAEVEGAEVAPTTEQEATFEEAPVEHSSEQETPTPLQMPMTEQGEPNFEVAGADLSAQYLTEQLKPEHIDGFVQVKINSAQKALEKAEKKQPKSTVFSEYKNEIAQIAEEKKQAQDLLAFWQDVKGKLTAIQTAPSVEAVAEETAPTETMVEETTPVAEEVTPENVEVTPEVAEQGVPPAEPAVVEEVSVEETTPAVEATEQVEVDDIPEVEAPVVEETRNRLNAEEAGLYGEGWENRADAKIFESLAKALGVRIELVDDIDNGLGNGKYFGNTILVRKKDRSKGLKFVAGHEILHRMSTLSPEAFEEFKGVVKETKGEKFEQEASKLKAQYTTLYRKGKVDHIPSQKIIEEEVVADFVGTLADSKDDALVQFVERNQERRTMLQTLRNAFQHILNLFGKNSNRRTAKNIANNIKAMDALMKLYDASVQNVANGQATPNQGEALNSLREENDINIDIIEGENGDIEAITDTEKGQALFSLRTYEEGGRNALEGFLEQRIAEGALTTTEAQDMLSQMDDIYRICNEMKGSYAPFGAWSEAKVVSDSKGNPVFSVIKQNGEYVMNLDFSLVCKKRRTLDAVLNEMVRRGMIEEIPNDNTTIAKINNVIRNYGFETACALCFVDARRFQVLNTAKQFTDLWNTIVRSAVPIGTELGYFDFANGGVSEGVAVELNTDSLTKMSDGRSVAARIAKHLLNNPNDARLLRPRDFVSTAGFDNVKAQNPAIMSLYNSKKGTGGPKAAFSDVQYLNDILNTKWKEEDAFAIGGVRLQSFSDYVPRMVFDYIQMIADLAAKGLPVHAYTKESLFAKTFGLTGMKINLSLVPDVVEGGVAAGLDADGNYVWKDGETFPYEEAIAIQNAEGYKENCGTIAVGVSDAHILKMLDDENIRMVIPYHKSGLPKAVAEMNNVSGFTDYTNDGHERHKSGEALSDTEKKEIPNFNELLREYNDPRRAAQAFLEWCESKNYTPRFAKFANHPNYYKVLEDFTTLVEGEYVPQEAVKFNFPTEGDAFGSLASLIEQGLEEDAILEGQRDEKVGAIVEEVGEVLGTPLYSIREMDAPYLEAVEKGDMDTAQRLVMEAAKIAMPNTKVVDEDGNPKVVYHQTNSSVYINRETGQNWDELDWRERMEWDERDDWDEYWEEQDFNTFSRVNARTTNEFDGFFFAPEYDEYHEYGDRTIKAFLNIESPAFNGDYNIDSSKNNAGRDERIRLQNEGFDGVIRKYDGVVHEYIAFNPNQIKSADPVTYDDAGNVIPLSERFNPRKEDIRYALRGEKGIENLHKASATIRKWMENNTRGKSFTIELPKATTEKVRKAMGRDFESHNITANGVAHAYMNHGENGRKLNENSIPLRKEDVELIPYIMTAPDEVAKASTDITGRESVRFYKTLSNGYGVVVEKEYKNSPNDMETITMWAELSSKATNARQNAAPDTHARNAILDTDIAKIRIDAENAIEKEGKGVFSLRNTDTFYSNAEFAVNNIKQEKATPEQWLKMIEKNGGLKAGEDKWLGLSDWLKASDKKTLTKEEVLDYINANKIQIEEVEYGEYKGVDVESLQVEFEELKNKFAQKYPDPQDHTYFAWSEMNSRYGKDFKSAFDLDEDGNIIVVNEDVARTLLGYSFPINDTRLEYTTNGLANKREIALVVPTIEPWNAEDNIHFGDAGEGRAVAWVRFGETTDADGKRVLVIDEIQSKRHQDGRESGYRPSDVDKWLKDHNTEVIETGEFYEFYKDGELDKRFSKGLLHYDINKAKNLYVSGYVKSSVPEAPFEKNWHELAMKRMLRYAAENGFDKVAWTTGDQQAERYNIGDVIERIVSYPEGDNMQVWVHRKGNERMHFTTDSEGVIISTNTLSAPAGASLADVFGKDLAIRIFNREGEDATIYAGRGKEYAAKEISGDGLRIGGEGMKGFYDQILPNFMNKYGKKWGVKVGEVTMPSLEENNTMHAIDVTDAMRNSVMQGQPLFSLRDYADDFAALQEAYKALNKNNAEAVAEFRARKRNLIEEYWVAMTDELGLPCEFILVDSTIGREALFPIYNVIKPVYEANFNEPLTFDDFAEEWENDVNYAASYVDGANIIVGDVVKFDDYNSQDAMTQLFIHENIHHFIDNYITPRELKRLWREVALTSLGRRVIETYPDADAAKLANEYLAYLIAGVNETDIEPLLDFIKGEGNVSLNDLLSSYGKMLPLRGRYATIILKTLQNGYEEREESRNEEGEEVGENNEPARQVEANNNSRGWLEENLREGQELRQMAGEARYGGQPFGDVWGGGNNGGSIVEFDETSLYSLRTSPEQRLIDENNIITRRLENAQEVALAKRKNQKEQGSVRTIEKSIFNRLADVEKMQDTLFEMGVEKSDANNFIARFEAVRNIVDYRNRKEQEKVIVPMLNIVSAINEKYGFVYADISDYLAAKHSIEREDVSSIQTMSTDADAVWNRAECERIVAEFEGKVSKEEVDELWNCVRAITQNTLSILQAGGVYTKEQIKEIQSNEWQFYVPLQGWDIEAEGLVDPSLLYEVAGRGTSSNGKWQEHSAEGRKTKPQDPLSTIAFKMYKAIYVAEYNKAMNALYYLVSDAVNTLGRDKTDFLFKASEMLYRKTENGYDEVDIESITQEELDFNNELEAKIKRLRKERREAGDKLTKERRDAIKKEIAELEAQRTIFTRSTDTNIPNEVIVPRFIDQARRVYFYVNGRRMYVQFANPKYSQAINGETIIKRTDVDNAIAKYTRFLSQSFTTFNPEFSFVTNPIRDFRDAVLTHLMDAENGNIGGFIYNYFFHWGRSQGAIYRAQRGTNNPLTAEELAKHNILNRADRKKAVRKYGKKRVEDTLFMWFAENGGITGYTQSSNIFTIGEEMKKNMKKVQNGDFSVHASAYRALADSAEIITRYATFLASLDKGQSVGQAVSNGRNVSVNFNRKGESSDKIGAYYSFFNASMQGIYKFFRLAKKYPARFGAVVVAQMALGYAMSRLVDLYVSTRLPDNDDDELTTIDIPLWMRLGYTCIPVIKKDGKMHVVRFPKSIAGASFSAVGVLLNELENGRVTRGEALSALGGQIASSWTYGFSEGAPIWRAAIPTAIQPLTDLITNMDAFGREIYRTDKFNRQIPASELGNKNVIPFIYEATKALNAATGGNEYKSGTVDINPSVVQYILQSVSGGYGVLARKTAEFISPAFSDQVEFEAQNLPMLGRLAYTVEPKSWYDDYAEYEEKYGSARLSNAKKEFKGGYITEGELEDIQKHNVIVKAQDKYINKLLDLRKQFDINTQGYNALSREINRQRGLMVKLMEEIDWSKDNIADEARRVASKYDPNRKDNLLKIRTEYANEN